MSGPAAVAVRLRGASQTIIVGAMAAAVLLIVGDATVPLPFLDDRHVGSPAAALLIATAPGIAFGAARRSLLAHLHVSAARSLVGWRAAAFLLCSSVVVPVAVSAPPGLGVACGRNVLLALGASAVAAVALDQGAAWAPLLVALLVMSIFGARLGDAYAPWAIAFQPSGSTAALVVALVVWTIGLVCEAAGLQRRLEPFRPPAPAGGA